MSTKKEHLSAILAMRMEWTAQDKLQASQLADLRYKLDLERAKASKAPATVSTAAGGQKANPIFSIIDRLARQEAQLTRRLNLGAKRTAGGQYKVNDSPQEARKRLWERWADQCKENLIPGLWLCIVKTEGVEIDEDSVGWPDNPKSLPTPGRILTGQK
ncbi:hypothetical protein [Caballeronia cordobensis]|uniref:hypothetical protein n=1 Tax=Caballeronia cordobensis TaxID=1353886 RepID=UPI001184A08D